MTEPREEAALGTPQRRLADQGRPRNAGKAPSRTKVKEAMLDCCGELGYRQVTVEDVYRRCGGYRSHFYRHFASKEDCYLAAYETESERIGTRLVALTDPAAEDGSLRGALQFLAACAAEHPLRARALLIEVHAVGERGLERRRNLIETVAGRLDAACRRWEGASPPPITSEFMVCVVEQALSSAVVKREPEVFERAVPELEALIEAAYTGAALAS
jgi:AcrR family transcriptional regulator